MLLTTFTYTQEVSCVNKQKAHGPFIHVGMAMMGNKNILDACTCANLF